MNKYPYKYFILCFVFLAQQVFAVPSARIPQQLIQADGSIVYAVQKGDERGSWMETTSGYAIEKNNNNWYYSIPKSNFRSQARKKNGVLAHFSPPIGLKKGLGNSLKVRSTRAPSIGQKFFSKKLASATGDFNGSVLFILAEFSDTAGSTSESSWGDLLNSNIIDYYHEVSYNKVELQAARESHGIQNNGVIGWLNIGNYHPGTDGDSQAITRSAIVAANPYVNYASYDKNNDGYVDSSELAIVVIVAGYETSYADYSPSVWGHAWALYPYPPVVDGVTVGAYYNGLGYAQFGEIHQSNQNDKHQATMGVMVHELGHLIFGFPDLYDTDGSSEGIGFFGVMGGGSWGKKDSDRYQGMTPVYPTAWIQYIQGWVAGKEVNGSHSITAAGMTNATSANTVYRLSTQDPSQYFLVQNRQSQGYDSGLELVFGSDFKGGLVIFHIDESKENNTNDKSRLVDVEEADGTEVGNVSYNDSFFWRSGNATNFNSHTNPSSNLNNGSSTTTSISSISEEKNIMTANFKGTQVFLLEPIIDLILN